MSFGAGTAKYVQLFTQHIPQYLSRSLATPQPTILGPNDARHALPKQPPGPTAHQAIRIAHSTNARVRRLFAAAPRRAKAGAHAANWISGYAVRASRYDEHGWFELQQPVASTVEPEPGTNAVRDVAGARNGAVCGTFYFFCVGFVGRVLMSTAWNSHSSTSSSRSFS